MAEDFTTYTEVDPLDKITKTSSRITWVDLTRNRDVYVYKDKTPAFFDGDFTHYLAIRVTDDLSESNAQFNYWALANVIDEWKGIEDASEDALLLSHAHPTSPDQIELKVIEIDGGTRYISLTFVMSLNTTYYLKIVRDESIGTYGSLYCYVYSDSARTSLLSTISVLLHSSKKDFRYIYGVMSYNGATSHRASAYTENLSLDELPPTLMTGIKNKGTYFHYADNSGAERRFEGTTTGNARTAGSIKTKGTKFVYGDNNGDERDIEGTLTGNTVTAGKMKVKGTQFRYGGNDTDERYIEGSLV